jgi:outer membrane lipoprotein SlyB
VKKFYHAIACTLFATLALTGCATTGTTPAQAVTNICAIAMPQVQTLMAVKSLFAQNDQTAINDVAATVTSFCASPVTSNQDVAVAALNAAIGELIAIEARKPK